ncbi:UDP-4-keto-6-deoxy-N-acetylglucosamine 4-aminotransferase [Bacteriovorax sp. BAL6_X]|uniref:UDP-4-amino-4, 6-dideoxy-N-acetyl-beta-L-altrosamine transaminase n=1 Tax=Bacteriovorax sp. BAL6_X TaxID=1201290 RepID=UPI0003859729|nr:UDP-4-amino-4,6-dideoxy-N-acetyl-beta-L-altrosamine transaminase [Bacteriovorax sp. BAL6_X]EPZ50339.1 UDP-4-keto-6-deoxy-N-acetylglucosamine 4-aminotransferase [Bacteriovorax sp. BAL6_X]
MIPYGKQDISSADIEAVVEVLKSPFLTQGKCVPEFEEGLIKYTGAKYCSVMNSATSALHLAYLALGVGQDDIVWTTPVTFVATSNAALMCGAKVDFVDIETDTLNISVKALEEKLNKAQLADKLPKVVTPVHMCGQSCDMREIFELSKKFGFKIIEDASHAVGGEYLDTKVGSCKYSDISIFSFHPVKIITTAEGGALLTNNSEIDKKVKLLRTHGVTKDNLQRSNEGSWYYEQHELGYNYRMTELQAALGISQLSRLDTFIERRNEIADIYISFLSKEKIDFIKVKNDRKSSYHLFVIKVEANKRKEIFEKLHSLNIGAQIHYYPVHKQPYYQEIAEYSNLGISESTYKQIISIPMYSLLKQEEIDYICDTLKNVIKE